jgi:hypothetical protein
LQVVRDAVFLVGVRPGNRLLMGGIGVEKDGCCLVLHMHGDHDWSAGATWLRALDEAAGAAPAVFVDVTAAGDVDPDVLAAIVGWSRASRVASHVGFGIIDGDGDTATTRCLARLGVGRLVRRFTTSAQACERRLEAA